MFLRHWRRAVEVWSLDLNGSVRASTASNVRLHSRLRLLANQVSVTCARPSVPFTLSLHKPAPAPAAALRCVHAITCPGYLGLNMDHKEVALRGKAISKAIEEKEPSSSILKLLNDLNDGIRPTEDLLRQTKIGVTVNKLRQHADPTVASLATRMVSKWREDVKNSKGSAARPKPSGASNGTSSPAPVPSKTASPAPAPAAAASKAKHSVAPEKRNHKTDNVKYQVTGDDQRDNCVRLMYDGLAYMSEERMYNGRCFMWQNYANKATAPADILKSARTVEEAVYDNAGSRVNDSYKAKIKSLFSNLKNKSSVHLRKRVQSGEIPPKRFATMTHEEMKSDERKAADEKLEKENMNNAMVAQVEKSISKEFQCGKCKQRMVSYSQAQTRSADEPMTTFCECMNCGNRWKFS